MLYRKYNQMTDLMNETRLYIYTSTHISWKHGQSSYENCILQPTFILLASNARRIAEIQFSSQVHMLPILKKHILKCRKIMTKNFVHKSRYFMWEHKVSRKNDIFVCYVKKTKKCLVKRLILAPKFVFFTPAA